MTEMVRVVGDEQRGLIEKEFESRGEAFLRRALSVVVDSPEAASNVDMGLNKGKEYLKAVHDERKKFTKPLNDHVDMINAKFNALAKPFEQGLIALNGKLKDYIAAQQYIIEARRRLEIEEAKEKLNNANIPPSVAAKEVVAIEANFERQKKAASTVGSTQIRHKWTYEMTDFSLVPEAFKMIDDAAVKLAISQGRRNPEIPGINIKQEPYVAGKGGRKKTDE